jgi:hypothetical protein
MRSSYLTVRNFETFSQSHHSEPKKSSSRSHCNSIAAKAFTMLNLLLPILFLFSLPIPQVKAQVGTINVTPLLSCTLTTFACPGVSGCCTIGGCCGGGCCANGYTCINEGISQQTCCPASDRTKCGTVTPVSPPATLLFTTAKPTLTIIRDAVVRFWIWLGFRGQHMYRNPKLPPGSRPWFGLDLSFGKDVRVVLQRMQPLSIYWRQLWFG